MKNLPTIKELAELCKEIKRDIEDDFRAFEESDKPSSAKLFKITNKYAPITTIDQHHLGARKRP